MREHGLLLLNKPAKRGPSQPAVFRQWQCQATLPKGSGGRRCSVEALGRACWGRLWFVAPVFFEDRHEKASLSEIHPILRSNTEGAQGTREFWDTARGGGRRSTDKERFGRRTARDLAKRSF